jgi:hypothetical protein
VGDVSWPVRLSPRAAQAIAELPSPAKEMVRDVLNLAALSPWGFPQWNPADPEGEDVRSAAVGQLTVVYWVNRAARRLSVLGVVWSG